MSAIQLEVLLEEPIGTISPLLHGHFMEHLGGCIDGGIWVGPDSSIPNTRGLRNDVVGLLKRIGAPVLRWPGGCFADDYHWRDGIGPATSRPRRVNMHWGHCIERNEFGTHEFMDLCTMVGAEPYIAGNLGSGTPKEMRDWVEYCNFPAGSSLSDERVANGSAEPFRVKYWGVGNENWGCGGNFSPEDYAAEYRRFSTYLRAWGGTEPYLIACGPNRNDLEWTRRFFNKLKRDFWDGAPIHGYSAHLYCHSETTATEFGEPDWYQILASANEMEPLILAQRALMDEYDPERKIGLIIDEWGAWHRPEPGREAAFLWQQSTVRDAVIASLTLDTFHRNADKLAMTNIAQTINVLQSMAITEGEHMIVTPTGLVFDLYRAHRDGVAVRTVAEAPPVADGVPALSASASISATGITVTMTNLNMTEPVEVRLGLPQSLRVIESAGLVYDGDVRSHNTVEHPEAVRLEAVAPPSDDGGAMRANLPPGSVRRITFSR